MNSKKGYFSIIQFCPDLARREAVNIGVVLFVPDSHFLKAQLVEDNERVRHFFGTAGDDAKRLKLFKKNFAARVASEERRIESLVEFQKFIDTRGNQIQLSDPTFVKARDCNETLVQLFEKLVGCKRQSSKRLSFRASLQARFEKAGIADRIRNDIPIEIPILKQKETYPFGFQNGAWHLLQPVRFESEKKESNFAKACRFSTEGKILQEHPDPQLGDLKYNVIGRFHSKADRSIAIVREVLAESNVRLILEHDLTFLVDEIRRTGKRLVSNGE